jgi:two-component system sensor histidine kinase MtrB
VRSWFVTFVRRVVHLWRASLGFRVVVVTMLLGVLVLTAVGTYLYGSIAQGLVDGRQNIAAVDSLRDARDAQASFNATDQVNTASDVQQNANDIIKKLQRNSGTEIRYVVLSRLPDNDGAGGVIGPIEGGSIHMSQYIPRDLAAAVVAKPDVQHIQVTTLTVDDVTVSALIVGQRVQVPVVGKYGLYFVYPLERERDIINLIGQTFLLGGAVLILLIGAIAFVVTRLVADPVRRAALVAERFAEGNLNERMRARGEDDLARLGNSFNAMAASIQQQIAQLENLSRVQQRFVSDVSHELRTPLTTIRMAADLIHDSRSNFDPTVGRSSELLMGELDRFESLLIDLLEISRFDAGAAVLDIEATDLRASVERAVDAHRTLAARKGTELVVTQPAKPVIAEMDSRRIERVLRNLISNAIEHGEGQPVEVRVGANDSAVAVTVRDHGVGLRPGEAGLVFTRFWRADPARARTTGGTGLGLAISLEDARLHAGHLEAWGVRGRGSCFRLTLPRRADAVISRSPLPLNPEAVAIARDGGSGRSGEPFDGGPGEPGGLDGIDGRDGHDGHDGHDGAVTIGAGSEQRARPDDTLRLRRIRRPEGFDGAGVP